MTTPQAVVLLPETVLTVDGAGAPVAIGKNRGLANVTFTVSLLEPGSTVDATVETGLGAVGTWVSLGAFGAIGEASTRGLLAIGVLDRLRVTYTVTGTVTASAAAITHQLYCEPIDVKTHSLPPAAVETIPNDVLASACLAATDEAVSYIGAFHDMPLASWGTALRMHTANMAAYHAVKRRGYNPDADPTIREGYKDAIEWLKRGAKNDPSIVDASPTTASESAFWVSEPPRGWQRS